MGPLSCSGTYSSSSTPTEHVPAWGVLSVRPNPTPYREKRSSASWRVCSFPNWPEGPTGWGVRAPSPCVHTTDPETELVWANHWGSWECKRPVLSGEQGLPPQLLWRHGATGTARRAGSYTDMPVLRTQTAGMACGAEGSTRGSTCPSTHCLSWVQWSKGCKTPSSYRLERLALSHPSPVGLWFLHAKQEHLPPSPKWRGRPWTWEGAGWTESHSRVWWSDRAKETDWAALARLQETVQVAPTEPPMNPRWGSEGERRDPAWASRCRSEVGQRVCNTYLRSGRGCVSSTIDRALELPTAAHWRERRVSVGTWDPETEILSRFL